MPVSVDAYSQTIEKESIIFALTFRIYGPSAVNFLINLLFGCPLVTSLLSPVVMQLFYQIGKIYKFLTQTFFDPVCDFLKTFVKFRYTGLNGISNNLPSADDE